MNKQELMNKTVLRDYIEGYPYYGKYNSVCCMCGSLEGNAAKMICEGNSDAGCGGIHLEFSLCIDCLLQHVGETMERMDKVMLRHEMEKEDRLIALLQSAEV